MDTVQPTATLEICDQPGHAQVRDSGTAATGLACQGVRQQRSAGWEVL
jgi:hypothetical protein